jgi:hypothetical protein
LSIRIRPFEHGDRKSRLKHQRLASGRPPLYNKPERQVSPYGEEKKKEQA